MAATKQAPAEDIEVTEPERLMVLGAAVVLKTPDGGERYLYKGAPVDPDAFVPESIAHATAVGLIGPA